MHKEKFYSSKTPLPLVILFLVNLFLIVSFQLLFIFKYPAEMDEATLAQVNPDWAGCTILSQDSYSASLETYLIALPDGSRMLVTTKPHSFILSRMKLVDAQSVESKEAEQLFYIKNGVHTSEIAVTGSNVTIRYGYGGGINEAMTVYLVLGAALEGLELLVYYFIKKNL